ncbi:MAG: NUDIX domain-containing protein [Treponema sp.]|jgi:ADP-ribose pyrophosphatase YjhB (NUDIX family)|nr:NUDIX domain-containing protein [Treponema sp.]
MFCYCPSCASKNISFENNHVFRCPDCGFVYYHNTAAAAGLIIDSGGRVMLLRRGKEPEAGRLDLPGGFIEPGEGALDGLIRECSEEIGWTPDREKIVLLSSFPNLYPYKNIVYNTCDFFFSIRADGLTKEMLCLQQEEIAGVEFIEYGKIDFDKIAFNSARAAIRLYLEKNYTP